MEKKKYKIAELANILDVSVPAIRKKVTIEGNKKRYKKHFEVINEDDTMFILLDDIELEREKELAFKNKNKFSVKKTLSETQEETFEDNTIIDVTPEKQSNLEFYVDKLETFTKRYIDDMQNVNDTLRETYKEMAEKDKQILLLEDFENRTKQDMLELQANNKTLQTKIKRYIKTIIGLSITFFIIVLVLAVFLARAYY